LSIVEQFPYCDRNPASKGLDLMPDLPIVLRHQSRLVSGAGLVDSGASISVLPYSLGVQLGFDWNTEKAQITLAGTLAHVDARGIVVEATVGQMSPVRLALAWAASDQVPFLLGQFNFFQVFDVCFFRTLGVFEIRQAGGSTSS
jgi:hypothetical protein